MIKKAIVVIGKEQSGKSNTIRIFKELIKIPNSNQKFKYKDIDGYIYSQTIQEKGKGDICSLANKVSKHDNIILPSRPQDCKDSMIKLTDIIRILEMYEFNISFTTIAGDGQRKESYYKSKAKDILDLLEQ